MKTNEKKPTKSEATKPEAKPTPQEIEEELVAKLRKDPEYFEFPMLATRGGEAAQMIADHTENVRKMAGLAVVHFYLSKGRLMVGVLPEKGEA